MQVQKSARKMLVKLIPCVGKWSCDSRPVIALLLLLLCFHTRPAKWCLLLHMHFLITNVCSQTKALITRDILAHSKVRTWYTKWKTCAWLDTCILADLNNTRYRTWKHLCSWWHEGHTLIQFKGSRVLSRCCVLVCNCSVKMALCLHWLTNTLV
jgi:hypothetical protein